MNPPALTPAQRISLAERKVWLSAHKAPPDMVLVSIQELGVMQETAINANRAITAHRIAMKEIVTIVKAQAAVCDAAKHLVDNAKAGCQLVPDLKTLSLAIQALEQFYKVPIHDN